MQAFSYSHRINGLVRYVHGRETARLRFMAQSEDTPARVAELLSGSRIPARVALEGADPREGVPLEGARRRDASGPIPAPGGRFGLLVFAAGRPVPADEVAQGLAVRAAGPGRRRIISIPPFQKINNKMIELPPKIRQAAKTVTKTPPKTLPWEKSGKVYHGRTPSSHPARRQLQPAWDDLGISHGKSGTIWESQHDPR